MVSNPKELRTSSDPLSAIDRSGPIQVRSLNEHDLNAILEAARPYSGRRRDGYFMALHRAWWINLLYYAGIQSLDVPEVLENVDPGIMLENGSYVANHILRLVQSNVTRLTMAKADWSVVPNTPDQQDQEGARVGQHLLDYAWEYLDMQRKRLEINFWLDTCGTAFLYTGWNVQAGEVRRYYTDPLSGQPLAAQQMRPETKQFVESVGAFEDRSDGDWDCEVIDPFNVFFNPRFRDMKKMPWILIRRTMSIEELWDRYPDKAGEIPPEQTNRRGGGLYAERLATLTHRPGLGLASVNADDSAVQVDEMWVPPTKRCPEGLYIIAVRDHILEHGPHPLKAKGLDIRFPLVPFQNLWMPGRFHAMSTVEHLIGPQREYNRARQQVIQHRDVLSVPQWLSPIGSLSKGAKRNEFGDIWEYNSRVGKPELVQPPSLGDAQIVSGQQAQADMQIIASFSDASLGQMPQGARSGNAVAMLQERDQLSIGGTVMLSEHSYQEVGTNLLKLAWGYMELPRAISIYGESRQADLRFYKGKDMNGNTRVWVKPGSMTPKSKAATSELLIQLMQHGAINPMDPREKRLILETLDVGGRDRLFALPDAARRRARIENSMFAKPDPSPQFALPDVTVFDDHQAHYETHLEFLYTDEYEMLDPMLKLAFQAHINKHIGAIAQALEAQLTVAGAGGQGAGGGSPDAKPLGKPSQPKQNAKEPSGGSQFA